MLKEQRAAVTGPGHQSRQLIYMHSLWSQPHGKGQKRRLMERPMVPKVRLENQTQAESGGLGRHRVGQLEMSVIGA